MIVKIVTLEGQTFDIAFEEDITIQKIRQKLLKDHNFNTDTCYFCRCGEILDDETTFKEPSLLETPIIVFNHQKYPDKSYPKVDDALQLNLTRYSNNYLANNSNSLSFTRYPIEIREMNHPMPSTIGNFFTFISRESADYSRLHRNILNNHLSNNYTNINLSSSEDEEDDEHMSPNITNIPYSEANFSTDFTSPDIINNRDISNSNFFDVYIDNYSIFSDDVMNFDLNIQNMSPIQPISNIHRIRRSLRLPRQQMHTARPLSRLQQQPGQNPTRSISNISRQRFHNEIPLEGETQNGQNLQIPANRLNRHQRVANRRLPPNRAVNVQNRRPQGQISAQNSRQNNLDQRENELNRQIIEALNLNIELSEDDSRSVSRLVGAGYDRANVIQVFMACDRNEEAAMNLLISI